MKAWLILAGAGLVVTVALWGWLGAAALPFLLGGACLLTCGLLAGGRGGGQGR